VGEGGVEASGFCDAAVDEGGVVLLDGEAAELGAEGGVGGGGFRGEDEAGGLRVEAVEEGGEEAVVADFGERGEARDEGVGEGVGFGGAEGVGGLSGGLVEGEEGVVFVEDGRGRSGLGWRRRSSGSGMSWQSRMSPEERRAPFLAGRWLSWMWPAAIQSWMRARSSQGKRRRSCRSRRSPEPRMVCCSWGIMGWRGVGVSAKVAGWGWRLAREDFFWILAARKPTGIFSALPLRGRPLADTSPARVVRKAASSENLPVIFADSPAKIQKKSSASTSCGRRGKPGESRECRKLEFSTVWKKVFHTVEKRADFSTQWKNFSGFFHTMEKKFSTVWKSCESRVGAWGGSWGLEEVAEGFAGGGEAGGGGDGVEGAHGGAEAAADVEVGGGFDGFGGGERGFGGEDAADAGVPPRRARRLRRRRARGQVWESSRSAATKRAGSSLRAAPRQVRMKGTRARWAARRSSVLGRGSRWRR
jgi:hypothetical protein